MDLVLWLADNNGDEVDDGNGGGRGEGGGRREETGWRRKTGELLKLALGNGDG